MTHGALLVLVTPRLTRPERLPLCSVSLHIINPLLVLVTARPTQAKHRTPVSAAARPTWRLALRPTLVHGALMVLVTPRLTPPERLPVCSVSRGATATRSSVLSRVQGAHLKHSSSVQHAGFCHSSQYRCLQTDASPIFLTCMACMACMDVGTRCR